MGRQKKNNNYREAVEKLRGRHADKVEEIFLEMYKIVKWKPEEATVGDGKDKKIIRLPPENKDRVNAAKVCVALLGVPRTGIEKPGDKSKGVASTDLPKPTEEELELINERLSA